MKTRSGFVSNSSATSFCICGIYEDMDKLRELFGVEDLYELPVCVYNQYYDDWAYVGIDISSMKQDETRAEFESRAQKTLEELTDGKKIHKVRFITDGWHDG